MDKKKYYVNLQSGEISQIEYQNNKAFTIHATENEVMLLRKKLDSVHQAEMDTFWRAHVPIMPYHLDGSNDRYDASMTGAFEMIYELGEEDTKAFIEESGVLSNLSPDDKR